MNSGKKFDIYLHPPCLDETDRRQTEEVLASGWVAPGGPWVDAFEKEIRRLTESPYAVALSSGTAALHLALKLLGIRQGDTVLVPAHTYIASASPVHYEEGRIALVDSEPETLNMSPDYLEYALRVLKKQHIHPRAIILTHLYGLPAQTDEILSVARRYDVPVIEDAAESVGSFYRGRHTGTWGRAGILSFNGNKTFTAGGGGALLLKDKSEAEKARKWAAHAKEDRPYFYHKQWGYNYMMPALTAGLGLSQLKRTEEILARKRRLHRIYSQAFGNLPLQPVHETPESRSNYWLNAFLLDENFQAGKLTEFLQQKGIEARRFWYPLHKMPLLKDAFYAGQGESETFFERGILLPSSPCLADKEIERIIEGVKNFFG